MEETKPNFQTFYDIDIMKLPLEGKAERLWHLFNEKILNVFLRDCERIMDEGIRLDTLPAVKERAIDFKVEYESMKRVYLQAQQDLQLTKGSDEGWKTIKIDDRCTISVQSNGTTMRLKTKGRVDLNIKHICYAAYLIKHYNQSIPFCKEAKDILEPSRVEKIGFLRISIPVPFIKDRSTLVRGVAFRKSEKLDTIYVFAEGVNEQKDYLNRFNINPQDYMKNRELFDLKHCVIEFKCLSQNCVEFSGAAVVDHHISFIPESLIMFVTKELGKFILNNLFDKLKDFQSTIWAKELEDNYNENREFYQWLDQVIDQCFPPQK